MDSDAALAASEDRSVKRCRIFPQSVPNWVMIDCVLSDFSSWDTDDFPIDNLAYEFTSYNDLIGVGLRPVRPPSASCLVLHWIPNPERSGTCSQGAFGKHSWRAMAVAAHHNYILLRFVGICSDGGEEFFVYQVSPPALRRLPACCHDVINCCDEKNIGIVRGFHRGFRVVHLIVTPKETAAGQQNSCPVTATLCFIDGLEKGGVDEAWYTNKCLPIRGAEDNSHGLVFWQTDAVLSFGDYICWVDYLRGMLFCNMFSENLELHFVPLPVVPCRGCENVEYGRSGLSAARTVCVTREVDEYVIRFVDVTDSTCWFYPHCSSEPGTDGSIRSWILSSDMQTWKLDNVMAAEEYLSLMERHHLPRSYHKLAYPLVDFNDPSTIYFAVGPQESTCLLTINMSMKTLAKTPYTFEPSGEGKGKEVHPCNIDYSEPFLPCEFTPRLWTAATTSSSTIIFKKKNINLYNPPESGRSPCAD